MSRTEHPGSLTLGRFFRSELSLQENRDVVRHLLQGCRECATVLGRSWEQEIAARGPRPSAGDDPLRSALELVARSQAGVDEERAAAAARLDELSAHPATRQILLVRNSRRFRTVALCELVLERALEIGFDDPQAAVATAELGCEIADRLDPSRYSQELVRDFQGRAWATLGNALRISSDLARAEEAFRQAASHLERGTGDPLELARMLSQEATLRNAQRRFNEAIRLLDRAITCYRRCGERHLEGKTRIEKGTVLGEAGRLNRAIRTLYRGIEELDRSRDPRSFLVAKHNLVLHLVEAGRLQEASVLLPEARELHERLGNPLDLVRWLWLEAKLHLATDRTAEAESALVEVVDAFVEREMAYPAAIAAMDLAAVYLRQGRDRDIRRLVADILPVFRALRIGREAMAALGLLARAVEREKISLELITEVGRFLRTARTDPSARFARGGSV